MKRRFGLFLMIMFLLSCPSVQARSYRFLDLQIEAKMGADGVVQVTETHTVEFNGAFSGMYQWIDTSGGIEVKNLVVSEMGVPYTELEIKEPGPAGTYYVQQKKNEVYVDWSFEAKNEVRQFELSYLLDNVVLSHLDVAEFYYQFVGDKWKEPRERVKITLLLPHGSKEEEIMVWGHGPPHGQVTKVSPAEIVWEVHNLPPRTYVEGRVVFPTLLVPGAQRRTDKMGLPEILAEEEAIATRLERKAKREKHAPYWALVMTVLVLAFFGFVWVKYFRISGGYKGKYYKELPADYGPAVLGILLHGTINGKDFSATLLDLARRGFLIIEEIGHSQAGENYRFKQRAVTEKQLSRLQPHETMVLKLLFETIGTKEVTLEEFQEFERKQWKELAEFWENWSEAVKEAAKKRDFFEGKPEKKTLALFITFEMGTLILGITFLALDLIIACIVSFIAFVVGLVFLAMLYDRRSPKGQEDYTKWRAYRRYLKDFSRVEISRVGSLGIWEPILPYAITLGVANQLQKQLEVLFPQLTEESTFCSDWFIFSHVSGVNQIARMITAMDNTFSTVTQGSISGGGGNFSVGGGGGFGGGGGGVR